MCDPQSLQKSLLFLTLNEIVPVKVFSIELVLNNSLRNIKGIITVIISASLLASSSTSPLSPPHLLPWHVH